MFNQRAKGTFTIEVGGPNHCGPDDTSPKHFDFEVELGYRDNALDKRGFLLDNLTFRQYFSSLGYTDRSCEQLARYTAHELYRQAQARARVVTVRLWALPGEVMVEYTVTRWKMVISRLFTWYEV